MNEEEIRVQENGERRQRWNRWGPYLPERQWGTVREDYSENGDAWNYFPFEEAHIRAYRWGEDGILGFSDNHQRLCFSFAFWNGKDPILKERMFGLANGEGNHGEDVKEIYYYLDATPSHSYMRGLYKYPHERFPYETLKEENRKRGAKDPEFELVDTKVFDQDQYFDLFIEYAKGSPEDILIRLTVENRGEAAKLFILPHLWFRNVWTWKQEEAKSVISSEKGHFLLDQPELGKRFFYFEGEPTPLFTNNETNFEKAFKVKNRSPFVKDAFHEYVIEKNKKAVNPEKKGTKSALLYELTVPSKGKTVFRFRLTDEKKKGPFDDFDEIFQKRIFEMERFYQESSPKDLSEDWKNIQRQAFAGLLWCKQFYHYVVEKWLQGDDPKDPPPESRKQIRNFRWRHLYNNDILSMPDSWEYPWFAAWDLAFHCVALALVDPFFAKRQLTLLTREWYMHPNGQVPAYEWNFDDVNPPVLAWAAYRVYKIEQKKHGREDRHFLESIFQKLIMNFTWWVNREDATGRNVFEGGFLGLDNISIFNRSLELSKGSSLTQSDATSWMGMFSLNMLTIAGELAEKEPNYEDMASKFFEHFLYIAEAINYEQCDFPPLWDEEDGFYYDLLKRTDGSFQYLKIHSLVGLIPLFAVTPFEEEKINRFPDFKRRFNWFLDHRPDLCQKIASLKEKGTKGRHLLSILSKERLKRILERMLNEEEFLSPYGIRSVSRFHEKNPFILKEDGVIHQVDYEPAESSSRLFGGNSNWRGPVWFPLNFLIIESLQKYHHYFGEDFTVEFPTGSGRLMTLDKVAKEISKRLIKIFEKDQEGKRAVYLGIEKFQTDPYFKDYLFFHEYFHGDNGKGLGASHQTGWTALVAKLIQQCGEAD